MATVSKWTPFDVALDLAATAGTVTRTAANKFTVKINASWETYYSGAKTNYGMTASSGGGSVTLNPFGTKAENGSGSFTGTYSISGNGGASKTIVVTFRNFNNDNGDSATKTINLTVSVPAWTSYAIKYNANGGTGAPGNQTKWKDQTLTLSSTKPTRTGYLFLGWSTSSTATSATYTAGANYTANAGATLYAVWKANTYTVTYNANGGTGAPATQTKTYGTTLTLSSIKPTRTNYTFKGWATSASATTAAYSAGASYTTNAAITLYAVWELAYTKPTIASFSVSRCSSDGTASGEGTYARVKFNWSTSKAVSKVLIDWVSGAGDSGSYTVAASGTSGSVDQIVGGGLLSVESSYTIRVTITDAGGTFTASRSLAGVVVPIEALAGGKGVAFGKVAEKEGYADFAFETLHRKHVHFENNVCIHGTKPDGTVVEVINPQNANGNLVLGYDLYEVQNGNSYIYGHDIMFGVSNIASPGTFKPYLRRGDSFTVTLRTAGYVTNAKKDVSFWLPLTCPIVGSPTITISSANGFIFRQGDKYTHGSSATVYVFPTSYEATLFFRAGLYIKAAFTDVTNVLNNDTIGIYWNGTVTLS